MSQWDGLPEGPPPADLLGKRLQKAKLKIRDAVVAMDKPPTEDQIRRVTAARQELLGQVFEDPDFTPELRVTELEGEVSFHVQALERLIGELSAQRGAQTWKQNALVPFRPERAVSAGPMAQRLRRENGPIDAAQLLLTLREALGLAEPARPVMVAA